MASVTNVCIVCGSVFESDRPAQTCSVDCFESFLGSDLGIKSEGANLYKADSEQFNKASGRGGWNSPLNESRITHVEDPSTPWSGDRTKFAAKVRTCSRCGAVLSRPDGTHTSNGAVVCHSCDAELQRLKPRRVKLNVGRAGLPVCDDCGSPLERQVSNFGFELPLACKVCGLVH